MAAPAHPRQSAGDALSPLLSVRGLTLRFGNVTALDGLAFDVAPAEIVAVIGPNGAGKTTLFDCLSRLATPDAGEVAFMGHALLAEPAHRVAHLGIGRTFQQGALFERLSVADNLRLGLDGRHASRGLVSAALRPARWRDAEAMVDARVAHLMTLFALAPYAERMPPELPVPIRRRVEIARAMAPGPKLLLLDEPAAGMTASEVADLRTLLRDIRAREGTAMLLVEHNVPFVMSVADRVIAIDCGRRIAEGPPSVMARHPDVVRAYLGTEIG
jgi:branched-chain amino acid transport system ATP-binding protein